MSESHARTLASTCRRLHAAGWVANHDGNVSCRLDGGRFLASPTAVSKAAVESDMVVTLDAEGKVVEGHRRVFSEISLHLACFRARPDVTWVLHAHPPTATGWAVAGLEFFTPPFLREPVVSLGDRVPCIVETDLAATIATVDAVLLRNHGVLTVGPDAETALLRMELVEHLARIALVARQLGGALPLPAEDVSQALAARGKAGLIPTSAAVSSTPSSTGPRPDLDAVVRAAMHRAG